MGNRLKISQSHGKHKRAIGAKTKFLESAQHMNVNLSSSPKKAESKQLAG